jgi:uncharacterized protein YbjT (DUF2867 family)
MRVVIAGGHGKIALYLERFLATRGDTPVGLIRNPAQADDLREVGAEPVVLDLEQATADEVAKVLDGADAAEIAGVRRFVQISSYGLDRSEDPSVDETFRIYLKAKTAAEEDLRARDLDWTIVRPAHLTDEPATGLVNLDFHIPPGKVPREEVAAVLVALLDDNDTIGLTLELGRGPTPIDIAISQVTSSTRAK